MTIFDFRTENEELYSPSPQEFSEVDVPMFSYLMVDGDEESAGAVSRGDAVGALLAASDAARQLSVAELGRDYVVGPLEGLWYAEHLVPFTQVPKSEWLWTMMIRQPEWLPPELLEAAVAKAHDAAPHAAGALRHARLLEGRSVQILHIGPYSAEGAIITRMHGRYLPQHRLVENGRHHEIYLSSPRATAPEKLRTVLRQPVRPAD
ncbi:GyrI-like domain-containing protein [Parafrigoribacterium mesophilum]|uniref:GyrI-like domain-containing protein n=1 Tax=Parafrigoribacterium mesophilum TaxID=433646 RepID=UPI0031FC968A